MSVATSPEIKLHEASVKGRTQTVEFYALDAVPETTA